MTIPSLTTSWMPGGVCALWISGATLAASTGFIAGADCSHVRFFEDRGIVYRDEEGARDALELLQERGLNCVRLRLFTSNAEQAASDPYNAINNLEYTVPLAVRVKQAGLQFMLDLHYSDSWADPGKQRKPSEWNDLPFAELEQRVNDYTRDVLSAFRSAGAAPDFVQVGNEIIGGFLWPDGRVGGSYENATQWSQFGRLLRSAIRGVREGAGESRPRVVIHIDRGADWGATQWFFDRLEQQEIPFDVIGQSYYPFWHGRLENLQSCLNQTATRYQKPVLIIETAFPWSGSTNVVAIPPTPQGQVEYVIELTKILRTMPEGRGMGIVWWGSEYVRLPGYALAGFDRRSFFDFDGRGLPVISALGQLTADVRLRIVPDGSEIRLTWPLSGAGLVLSETHGVYAPGTWTPMNGEPQFDELGFSTALPVADRPAFYRLELD